MCGTDRLASLGEVGISLTQCFKLVLTSLRGRLKRKDQLQSDQPSNPNSLHESIVRDSNFQSLVSIQAFFQNARLKKNAFAEACAVFADDPNACFRLLQSNGFLPSPLTPAIVAQFLRSTVMLDKEAVGAFLGTLGKDKSDKEWCTVEFHRELLIKYVETFHFHGETALQCLRIFLSAFRIPGEAQQIDRVLVAFSEYCHQSCIESERGIFENSEVTYLLMFSIIMLNTDRHNPNIRPDRKVTLIPMHNRENLIIILVF
jgi:brefeldin A-resistance guanine nucleotide exchange factor 1